MMAALTTRMRKAPPLRGRVVAAIGEPRRDAVADARERCAR
jgi:hypothetical protein